jgi:hypothetical protein
MTDIVTIRFVFVSSADVFNRATCGTATAVDGRWSQRMHRRLSMRSRFVMASFGSADDKRTTLAPRMQFSSFVDMLLLLLLDARRHSEHRRKM